MAEAPVRADRVRVAPVGADPADESQWTDLGTYVADWVVPGDALDVVPWVSDRVLAVTVENINRELWALLYGLPPMQTRYARRMHVQYHRRRKARQRRGRR